jgi:hypothetical protein
MRQTQLLIIATMLLTACADETSIEPIEDTPAIAPDEQRGIDIETKRIFRIDVEPGHTISFYELEHGTVGMIEDLDPALHHAITDREQSPRAVYRLLRPEGALPVELDAAIARADAVPPTVAAVATGAAEGGGERFRARTSSNADGFINGGACDITLVSGENAPFASCKTNWSGGYWAQINNVQKIHGHVQSMQGAITGRVQVGTSLFDKSIASGGYAIYSFGNSTAGVRRLDVFNATNDWFHVSAKFRVCSSCSSSSNSWWDN